MTAHATEFSESASTTPTFALALILLDFAAAEQLDNAASPERDNSFLRKNGVFEEIKLILRSQLSQYFWRVLMIVKSAVGFENFTRLRYPRPPYFCGFFLTRFHCFQFFLSNYRRKLDLDLSVILSL